jgi:hypothetical protein
MRPKSWEMQMRSFSLRRLPGAVELLAFLLILRGRFGRLADRGKDANGEGGDQSETGFHICMHGVFDRPDVITISEPRGAVS